MGNSNCLQGYGGASSKALVYSCKFGNKILSYIAIRNFEVVGSPMNYFTVNSIERIDEDSRIVRSPVG